MGVVEFKEKAKQLGDKFLEEFNSNDKYWLVRFVLLRFLGLTYLFAFLSLALQVVPLLGGDGILPVDSYLSAVGGQFESAYAAFMEIPSIFWFGHSDTLMVVLAWIGVVISLVVLLGYANVPLLFTNWFLYLSFVNVGQIWYSYGWEIQLLETGFLALFFVPFWNPDPFPEDPPPVPVLWLFRLLAFKVHLGAGLIKLRGSECWDNLTCLYYHYETQPIPNPLSPFFHYLPEWFHKFGVLVTHFVQTVAPFFVVFGRWLRNFAGAAMLLFQAFLMFTGNYAFLNVVTMIAIISYFDDDFLEKVLPDFITDKAEEAKKNAKKPGKVRQVANVVVLCLILTLSIPVFANLLSDSQAMNRSYSQWNIVNTYGAFGSVGQVRNELIIEGTDDTNPGPNSLWKEYDLPAKPGPVDESLPVIAPYQPRIDWQIWFAAMSRPDRTPWLIHYVWKLLDNDPAATALLEKNPFPNDSPEYIRIQLYRYEFAEPGSEQVWKRTLRGTWLPPVSKDTQQLKQFVERRWG